jgi:hypothetical protein
MTQRTVVNEPDDRARTMIYDGIAVDRRATQVSDKAITKEHLAITGVYRAKLAKTVADTVYAEPLPAKTVIDTVIDEPEQMDLTNAQVRDIIVNDFYLLEDKVAQAVLLQWWKEYISAKDKQPKKVELRDILFKGVVATSRSDKKVLQRLINKVAHWNLHGIK